MKTRTNSGRLTGGGREHREYAGRAAQSAAMQGGWSAARYHCEEGETVSRMLSFRSVFEINPFEVGGDHAAERRRYRAIRPAVIAALDLKPLMSRAFAALSNGEMRRVLLARELLCAPDALTVEDPFGGLDHEWRRRMESLREKMRDAGVELTLTRRCAGGLAGRPAPRRGAAARSDDASCAKEAAPVLEMRNVHLAFGRRTLFKNLSWRVMPGERWLLRGPNGSGKTTLLALVTGDSPLGYANDISLFGRKRGERGTTLAQSRRKIGIVSVERALYDDETVERQLDEALTARTRLLILDEPCCDMPPMEVKNVLGRIGAWLDAHPSTAAICVAHAPGHVPPRFSRVLTLPDDAF